MKPILKIFNSKLQTLNQSGGKHMMLTAKEARDLQAEIFNILAQISYLEDRNKQNPTEEGQTLNADGGKF